MPKHTPTSQQDANRINEAAGGDDVSGLKALLERGVDINACDGGQGLRPLITAAKNGCIRSLQLLIKHGARIDVTATYEYPTHYEGFTALMAASECGHLECVKALTTAGADLDCGDAEDGTNALVLAARNGHIEIVRHLLRAGAGISRNALVQATTRQRPEMVKLLLTNGGDAYLRQDTNGRFLRAVFWGPVGSDELQQPQLDTLNVLLDAGADVNATDVNGMTPLIAAIRHRNPSAICRLLQAGANVHARTAAGDTAMHFAAGSGLISAVEELLKAGAGPHLHNKQGQRPVDEAERLGQTKMVKFFEQRLDQFKGSLPGEGDVASDLPPQSK